MDFAPPPPNRLQKGIKWLATTSPGWWILSRTLNRLDRLVARVSHHSLATILAGLPVLQVTTRDATTGAPHTIPLVSVPRGRDIILIASNWGGAWNPRWYDNLKAHPDVTVTFHGKSEEFTAREVDHMLRNECWRSAVQTYPGFEGYQRRAKNRRIPVILLTPKHT